MKYFPENLSRVLTERWKTVRVASNVILVWHIWRVNKPGRRAAGGSSNRRGVRMFLRRKAGGGLVIAKISIPDGY